VVKEALLALLRFYKLWISPALHWLHVGQCKYLPTCSEYAQIAILRHGAAYGSLLAAWRVLRCNPFSKGGVDEVPPLREKKQKMVQ
jgi:putative membrane protein insertion efficiency factor